MLQSNVTLNVLSKTGTGGFARGAGPAGWAPLAGGAGSTTSASAFCWRATCLRRGGNPLGLPPCGFLRGLGLLSELAADLWLGRFGHRLAVVLGSDCSHWFLPCRI